MPPKRAPRRTRAIKTVYNPKAAPAAKRPAASAPGRARARTTAEVKKTSSALRSASKGRSAAAPGQLKKAAGLQNASTLAPRAPQAMKTKTPRAKGPTAADIGTAAGGVSRNFGKGVGAVGRGVRDFAASVIPFSRQAQSSNTISDAMTGAPKAREALRKAKGK